MALAYDTINTPVGSLTVEVSAKGLRAILYRKPFNASRPLSGDIGQSTTDILKKVRQQLSEYFQGKRKEFDLPLDLQGTEFQRMVWQALLTIPFGTTVSYAQIAAKIKNPKAVRAVGSANGKNPVCIIVPCHRVIASDGTIGGYSGGLAMKRQLLTLEGVNGL